MLEFSLSILLSIYLNVKFLDHMTILHLMLWRTTNCCFPQCYLNFHFQQQCTRIPIRRHPHQYFFHISFCYSHPKGCTMVFHHGNAFGFVCACPGGSNTGHCAYTCILCLLAIASTLLRCSFDLYFSSDEWHLASFKNI